VDNRIDESDSLSLFLKERLRKSDMGSLTTKLILDSYSSFCREHGWGFPGEQTVFRRLNHLMTSLFEAQPTKHIKNAKGGDERGYRDVPLNLTKPQASTVDSTNDWRQHDTTSSNFYQIQPQSPGKVPGRHIARDEQLCGLRVAPLVVQRLPGGITNAP
jgi:hypothetical protein